MISTVLKNKAAVLLKTFTLLFCYQPLVDIFQLCDNLHTIHTKLSLFMSAPSLITSRKETSFNQTKILNSQNNVHLIQTCMYFYKHLNLKLSLISFYIIHVLTLNFKFRHFEFNYKKTPQLVWVA